jgi:hypothetical protein
MLADAEGLTVTPLYTTPPAAQPAPVQEPVFELQESGWEIICDLDWIQTLPFGTKLYTTPPAAQRQWVGLTEDELVEACPDNSTPMSLGEAFVVYGRAIEAKLREKNGGAA